MELLERQPLARMAYTGTDGFPRVIPIGFLWNGKHIVVCTAPTSPKVRALAARPHVALTIENDDASRTLSVRGVAAMDIVDGVPDEYLAASAKGMSGERARQFEAHVRSIYKQMARISIEPCWARYYDFAGGRVPEFLLRLVNDNSQRLPIAGWLASIRSPVRQRGSIPAEDDLMIRELRLPRAGGGLSLRR